ncbi:MAG: ATPase [Defluviitaleaceae bacterium]|nr:ATPase [Defluviitaleaceae bacterium]
MESLQDYLEMLEDLIEGSKTMPFSNKVSLDKEQIFDIINDMRLNLPNEIRQAQKIIDDHDRILGDARHKAAQIVNEAEHRAQEMADEHEIYKLAVEQSKELMDDTKRTTREMRNSTVDYADDLLLKTENAIRESMNSMTLQYRAIEDSFSETIEVLYANRQELRESVNHQ